jgi:hypothetical protein
MAVSPVPERRESAIRCPLHGGRQKGYTGTPNLRETWAAFFPGGDMVAKKLNLRPAFLVEWWRKSLFSLAWE